MKKYYTTIGIEVHAELNTDTKMFCKCINDPFAGEPNAYTCPVCMAHPGSLPVVNHAALDHMVRIGLAVGGQIANFTEFDRKNYFYPDIPKGYQITQFKYPIVSGGTLAGVDLTRIHLEEDTATSKHQDTRALIDYNRAGVPLMELVTEPVMHSAAEAMEFGRQLQLLLRYLGASNANMEKGEMRVEANVSISPDLDVLGTKVEIKNINSFSIMGKAIDYEVARMTKLWEEGRQGEIVQQTIGWNAEKQETYVMRAKEDAAEYRYFPEPDLPKFHLHEIYDLDEEKMGLPELPWERETRYKDELGLKSEVIDVLLADMDLATLFQNVIIPFNEDVKKVTLSANYLTSDLVGLMKNENEGRELLKMINATDMSDMIDMIAAGDLNSRGAKSLFPMMIREGKAPNEIAEREGMLQQNDEGALQTLAEKIIAENPDAVEKIKAGKDVLYKFMVGQAMKESKGSANPQVMEGLFRKLVG